MDFFLPSTLSPGRTYPHFAAMPTVAPARSSRTERSVEPRQPRRDDTPVMQRTIAASNQGGR